MFDLIRDNQRILLLLLVLLIFPAFALFGISGYDRVSQGGDAVAKVGDLTISTQDFENARQGQMQSMRRILGEQFDPAMLDTPAARNEILEQLISQRVLANAAQEKTVIVPDVAIRNAIAEIPAFRDESGQFSIERYRTMLSAQGRSEIQFENQIRAELALQSIPRSVSETAIVPRSVSRQLVALNQEKRKFRSRTFKTEDYIESVEIDTAKAKSFYDENPDLFKSTESLKIEYLVLSESALTQDAEVTDSQIKEYYEQNQAAYVQEEQRRARHILINMAGDASDADKDKARAKAQDVLSKLRDGAEFEALAKSESQDPGSAEQGGDLGFFDRQTMTKPFADAAFSLGKDVISDIVETEFGLHILQVTDIRERQQEPLDKARPKVLAELKAAQGRQAFHDAADIFTNTAYEQPDSLAPVADKLGIALKTIDQYQRFGTPGLEPGSPLASPKVVRALFAESAIKSKKNIDAIEVSPNELVVARVLEHRPSKVQDFAAVEADAISRVRAKAAANKAKADGEALLAQLKDGAKPDKFDEPRSVDRYSSGLPQPATSALFEAAPDKFPEYLGVDLGQRGFMIQELIAVEAASSEEIDKALDSFTAQAASAQGQHAAQGFVELLKGRVLVERFADRLTSAPADAVQ